MSDRTMRYCLVRPDGEISFGSKSLHQIRAEIIDGGVGETGLEHLNSLYPVAAYYHVPFDKDDRRMNKAANGMFWELSAPTPPGDDEYAEAQEHHPGDRVIKMRGLVAFIDRHNWGLSTENERDLREAHQTAVERLRARGWL
jgi:hypothetical protein